jgi:hypothetical protein
MNQADGGRENTHHISAVLVAEWTGLTVTAWPLVQCILTLSMKLLEKTAVAGRPQVSVG